MHTRSITVALSVFMACSVALGLAACSSDEDEGTGGAGATGGSGATGSGGSGATGSGGSGATGSGGTAGGTGGSGGGAPAPIDCQGTTCEGIAGGMFNVAPCCAGTAGDQCGVSLPTGGCQPLNEPGDPDESCTEAFQGLLDGGAGPGDGGFGDGGPGFTLTGCCRPDGTCGLLLGPLGCTDLVSQFGDAGPPISCTP